MNETTKKYFSTYYWLETGELGTVLVIAGHQMMTVSGPRLVSASLRGSGNDAATSYYRIMAPPTDQKHNPAFWSQGKLLQWMISLRQDSTLVTLAMENVDTDLVRVKIVGNRLSEINFRMKKTLQVDKLKKYFGNASGLQSNYFRYN